MNINKKPIISVAPMLDVTNTHFRTLCRIISKKVELWTEMVVDDTIIHCYKDESRRKLLDNVHFLNNEIERPLILQLGGNDPDKLEKAIEIASKYGFQYFNLNVGCPSTKVACKGHFGASLFKTPSLVARIVHKCNLKLKDLKLNTRLSIKTRIGVDQYDTYQHLFNFISIVSGKNINNKNKYDFISIFSEDNNENIDLIDYNNYYGANYFVIHARKAFLNGIDPSKNRTIPQLNYLFVYKLTFDFPELTFVLNGGVTSIKQAVSLLDGSWFLNEYFNNNCDLNTYDNIKRIKIEDNNNNNNNNNNSNVLSDNNNNVDNNMNNNIHVNNGINNNNNNNSVHVNNGINNLNNNLNNLNVEDNDTLNNYYKNNIYNSIKNKSWNSIYGIMIGREVMNNPFILSNVDQIIYGIEQSSLITRKIVLNEYCDYLKTLKPKYLDKSDNFTTGELNTCLNPILGIFHGYPGAKLWRRLISENIRKVKKENNNKKPYEILQESIIEFEKVYPDILNIYST